MNPDKYINKPVFTIAVTAALTIAAWQFDLQYLLREALTWISSPGANTPLIFVALYIVACVFMLPVSVLTLGAGVLFGVVYGSIIVSIGATSGATAAFLAGRCLARGWVTKRIAGLAKRSLDRRIPS